MKRKNRYLRDLSIYWILRFLVLVVLVVQLIRKNYENAFLCILTLVLFLIPVFVDRTFHIKLPTALETSIFIFIFAAEILGEIGRFYLNVPHWDTVLHTVNGFLMAAIGFLLVDKLNHNPRFHFSASPFFVCFVAFCFSMTTGVVWEFFEYGMDRIFHLDMQKDVILTTVSSVKLNEAGLNVPVLITGIRQTVVQGFINGEEASVVIKGYLDIGIVDTMKDLLVNCIGAIVFSIFGFIYISGRDNKIAGSFIPRMKTQEEIEADRRKDKKFWERRKAAHKRLRRIRKQSNGK